MMSKLYISNYCRISQGPERFDGIYNPTEDFRSFEPNYEEVLDIRSMRRMSPLLKMGTYTAMRSMANLSLPQGIMAGTGLGCTHDTLSFLNNLIDRKEILLNPTAFIQSTHNTLAGMLGISLKVYGYNITLSQRFESLLVCIDEILVRMTTEEMDSVLLVVGDEMSEAVTELVTSIPDCDRNDWSEGAAAFYCTKEMTANSKFCLGNISFGPTINFENNLKEIDHVVLFQANPFLSQKEVYRGSNAINMTQYTKYYCTADASALCMALDYKSSHPNDNVMFVGGGKHHSFKAQVMIC